MPPKKVVLSLKRRSIDNDLGAFGLDALHDALAGGLTDVIAIRFHHQTVDAQQHIVLHSWVVGTVGLTGSHDFLHSLGDKILGSAVRLANHFNSFFGTSA